MLKYVFILCLFATTLSAQSVFEVSKGDVKFYSDAPQELIKAYSGDLEGVVNFSSKKFAFRISISSFEGFNSPLQREHFNENYMETGVFPNASFVGKIIEDIDLKKNETYKVRVKGKMKIHGVEKERILYATVTVKNKTISIKADFIVLLADHHIKVPRVVNNKLSQEIHVAINADLKQK